MFICFVWFRVVKRNILFGFVITKVKRLTNLNWFRITLIIKCITHSIASNWSTTFKSIHLFLIFKYSTMKKRISIQQWKKLTNGFKIEMEHIKCNKKNNSVTNVFVTYIKREKHDKSKQPCTLFQVQIFNHVI